MTKRIRVVAAAIFNARGEVLTARRHIQAHQGGLWEFPGGKMEPGETREQALARELDEELGIRVVHTRPLIRVEYDYPDKSVELDVWQVDDFAGEPHGREGQPIRWSAPRDLAAEDFPAANVPIVTAVRLPDTYMITPEPEDKSAFLRRLEWRIREGQRLIQLRAKSLDPASYGELAQQAVAIARCHGATLLLNAPPERVGQLGADGVHLTAARLLALDRRPLPRDRWVAASCHNEAELDHAINIGVDFAVLSPVLPTRSHPGAAHLGFDGFERLCSKAPLPVYALGGLSRRHLDEAFRRGAQGIAAIGAFW